MMEVFKTLEGMFFVGRILDENTVQRETQDYHCEDTAQSQLEWLEQFED